MTHHFLLLGAGAHGFNTYLLDVLPPLIASGRIRLSGIVEPDPTAQARALATLGPDAPPAFVDLPSALASTAPHALIVCSPYSAHEADCRLGASLGLHLFIEKPVCGDLTAVCRVIQWVDAAGVKAAVNMSARYESEKLAFTQAVLSGAAGRVEYLFARSSWNHEANARFRASTPHPYLTEAGVHALDLLRICAGGRPRRVFNLAWPSPESVFQGCASSVVSFEMDNGVCCVLEGSWSVRAALAPWRDEYIRADGSSGSLLLDRRQLCTLQGSSITPMPCDSGGPSGTTRLFTAFLDWLDGSLPSHPTGIHSNLDCMALLFAANASAESGQAVDVPAFLATAQAAASVIPQDTNFSR